MQALARKRRKKKPATKLHFFLPPPPKLPAPSILTKPAAADAKMGGEGTRARKNLPRGEAFTNSSLLSM